MNDNVKNTANANAEQKLAFEEVVMEVVEVSELDMLANSNDLEWDWL